MGEGARLRPGPSPHSIQSSQIPRPGPGLASVRSRRPRRIRVRGKGGVLRGGLKSASRVDDLGEMGYGAVPERVRAVAGDRRGPGASRGKEAHDGHDHGRGAWPWRRRPRAWPSPARSCGSRPRRWSGSASGSAATIARAADLVYRCPGSVIVTGMGKAGLVGQKLAATLASTGTRRLPAPPGRGGPRRPRPHPRRRRGDRPLAERRDRGGPPPGPGPAAAGGDPGRDHRAGRAARSGRRPTSASRWGRSRRPARWAWPRRPARPR